VAEILPVTFNFNTQLQFGEEITGALVTATVFTGVDSFPSAIIEGSATFSTPTVNQQISGGVAGVVYLLVAVVNTDQGNTYTQGAKLAVISGTNMFLS